MNRILESFLLAFPIVTFFSFLIYGLNTQQIWIMFVGAGLGILCLHIRFTVEKRLEKSARV